MIQTFCKKRSVLYVQASVLGELDGSIKALDFELSRICG